MAMSAGFIVTQLITAVQTNDIKMAYEMAGKLTSTEREGYANILEVTSRFLKKYTEDWNEALKYPAENEE